LLRYLTKKEYNEKLTANEKRAPIRKRAESFILKEYKMYYRVGEGILSTKDKLAKIVYSSERITY
jgi:hypothetical protein